MPPDVLDHIIAATDARPRGSDRWIGHGICHGSKKNRDLSIRLTNDRILLYDFAGCSVAEICAALNIRIADLFDDGPLPPGSRPLAKHNGPDHGALAFRFELAALDHRLRAQSIFEAAEGIDISIFDETELDRALDHIATAYDDLRRAECFESEADALRQRHFAERKSRERQTRAA